VQATPKQLLIYVTQDGREPFSEWLVSLKDAKARAKIRVRLDRVSLGNPGDCHGVGEGVQELRIDYGPGYRVYFGQEGHAVVLLLCGGDKRT
jgi:putative addiction module killer protein